MSSFTDSQTSDDQNCQPGFSHTIEVTCADRWQVYHRLRELDIDCDCTGFQPLQVKVQTPVEAVQLWSIIKRVCRPRLELAADLQRCWHVSNQR